MFCGCAENPLTVKCFHQRFHTTTEERDETEDQTAPGKPSEGGAVPGQQDCDGAQSML